MEPGSSSDVATICWPIEWNSELDIGFSKILADKYREIADKKDYILGDKEFTDILEKFNDTFGVKCSIQQLRSRLKDFMKQMSEVNLILRQKGFKWNFDNFTLNASDADWIVCAKVHKFAIDYKDVTLKHLVGLKNVFDNIISYNLNKESETDDDVVECDKDGKEITDVDIIVRQKGKDLMETSNAGLRRRVTRGSLKKMKEGEGSKVRYTKKSIIEAKRKAFESLRIKEERNKRKKEDVMDEDIEMADMVTVPRGKKKEKVVVKREVIKKSKKAVKKKNKVETDDEEECEIKYPSIITRTSPKPFYDATHSLSKEQEMCVREMGLGSMIRFGLEGIHAKLGFYLVDNFNGDSMELRTTKGSIKITCESVNEMLGLPIGGIQLNSIPVSVDEEPIISEWKKQFDNNVIKVREVVDRIIESEDADWNFKLNFLVVFANTMAKCRSRGTCNLDVLGYVSENTDFKGIDWCEYIWSCLKRSKNTWKNDGTICYYVGPITLLSLIYLDGTHWNKQGLVRTRPAIKGWNLSLLRQRVKSDLLNNGFGTSELLPAYEKGNTSRDLTDDDVSDEVHPTDATGYVVKMEKMFDGIIEELKNLVKYSGDAKDKYPNVIELVNKHRKFSRFLEKNEETTAADEDGHGNESFVTPRNIPEEDRQLVVFSPWSPGTVKEIENSMRKALMKTVRNLDVDKEGLPSFSLGLTQDFETDTCNNNVLSPLKETDAVGYKAEPLSTIGLKKLVGVAVNKGKRATNLSIKCRSPYISRMVDVNSKLSVQEKNTWSFLFNAKGSDTEEMFAIGSGIGLDRFSLESFAPGSLIDTNVIDSWSSFLNVEENKRDPDKPMRLFWKTSVMNRGLLNKRIKNEKRLDVFRSEFIEVTCGAVTLMNLDNIDIVIFPVIQNNHYYLVCFNLKKPDIVVIDSDNDDINFDKKYKGAPEMLKQTFVAYLELTSNVKSNAIEKEIPKRLEMKWRTIGDEIDSGVFIMRHMESFMGDTTGKWDCGLQVDEGARKSQLSILRSKYVAKMLLSEHNIYRNEIMKSIGELGATKK